MPASGLRSVLAARPLPGQIGRYEIISCLGVGTTARVFLALRRGPGTARKLLAIKQLRSELATGEAFLAALASEGRTALRFVHPNVVRTFEVVAEAGEAYLALEYLEGQSLASVLRRVGRENLPRAEHIWILTQVLAGLYYTHTLPSFDGTALRVVHRGVSPSSVFITYTGQVKIMDFDVVRAALRTNPSMIKQEPAYAAPELRLDKPVDARCDVFAVGVMLWEALALSARAEAEAPAAMARALEASWPQLPAELARITQRALAEDPRERFSSALELQLALEAQARQPSSRAGQTSLAALMTEYFPPASSRSPREPT